MRELNKTKSYYLGDLTLEQKKELIQEINIYAEEADCVTYLEDKNIWISCSKIIGTDVKPTNAKELFYTLENVQVDCRDLSEDQIKEMADVFEANGFKGYDNNDCLFVEHEYTHLLYNKSEKYYIVCLERLEKHIITYSKFMELFAPKYDVTMIVEAPNDFKQITDSIASLLQYKNEKYGNSALEPLNVFQGKCKVGQRLDDKLARVKNNDTLQKNDVADLIGYLFLVCKENNWNNFDEFKD